MTDFLSWLENSAIGIWVAESVWGYPIVLSSHAVGMSIVVGTVVMIDIRVLGFAGTAPIKSFDKLFYVVWIGVVLNVLSGVALFTGDPTKFFYHPVFWVKIALIVLGAFLAWLLLRIVEAGEQLEADLLTIPRKARVIAALSLLFWCGAIITGRLVAYIELT